MSSAGKRKRGTVVSDAVVPNDASVTETRQAEITDVEFVASLGVSVHPSWTATLAQKLRTADGRKLLSFVAQSRKSGIVYPANQDMFTAIRLTPLDGVRVCILGQDPYHG